MRKVNIDFYNFHKRMMSNPYQLRALKYVFKNRPDFWEKLLLLRLLPYNPEKKREWFE